jgi:hypothetical protein
MLKSILKPEHSVAIGIGVGAVDLLVFNGLLPNTTDVRTANPQNTDVESERRKAVIYCVGINGFVSLITRDWTIFLIGGIVTIGMSYVYAHANEINPATGKMVGQAMSIAPDLSYEALPDYGMQQTDAMAS